MTEPTENPPPALGVRDLVVRFGGIVALDGVSFDVPRGAILGLIGPNGAGKTTVFNCLSRLYVPDAGDILIDGRSILSTPAHAMAGLGVGRTFQNLALFGSMSVLDNVMVGGHARSRSDFLSSALGLPWIGVEEARLRERAWDVLAELGLADTAHARIGDLPFGTRKRVELARALAARPRLLLLDEPAGGLNHDEVAALGALIVRLRDEHALTVVLVEHHMGLVMSVSDTVVVLDFGRKIAEGLPRTIQRDPEVIRAYLGTA